MSASLLEQVVAGRTLALLPLTVDQYHRMIELGILREGQPTELIDGILVRKDGSDRGGNAMAHGPRHALTLKRVERLLRPFETMGYHLHSQLPVTLSNFQEPEPDLAIVKGRAEDYQDGHPGPGEVLAVIEVSESTLEYDRTIKQRLYATAGIAIYWIVNLVENRIEVYEQPRPGEERYGSRTDYQPGQSLRLGVDSNQYLTVSVVEVLPPLRDGKD